MKEQRKKIKGTDFTISRNGKVYDRNGKQVKQFNNPVGYPTVIIDGIARTVAFLVANEFVDNPNNEICIGYKDNDITNVKADNLFYYYAGTYETMADKIEGEKEQEEEYSDSDIDFEIEPPNRNGAYKAVPVVEINEEGEIVNRYKSVAQIGSGLKYALKRSGKYKGKVYMIEENYSKEKAIQYYQEAVRTKERKECNTVTTVVEVDCLGKIVREYNSVKECAKEMGLNYDALIKYLRGMNNYKYKDNYFFYGRDYSPVTTPLLIERFKKEEIKKLTKGVVVKTDLEDNVVESYCSVQYCTKRTGISGYKIRKGYVNLEEKFKLKVLTEEERNQIENNEYKKVVP